MRLGWVIFEFAANKPEIKMTNQTTIRATLLFVFNSDLSQVLLIEKTKPDFHKGLLNGLGGKNFAGESDLTCASRELKEESNLIIPEQNWKYYAHLHWQSWDVPVLAAVYSGKESDAKSMEDEVVAWHACQPLPKNCISNLTWLIPMAKDALQGAKWKPVVVHYKK